jgi:hypothetical protein
LTGSNKKKILRKALSSRLKELTHNLSGWDRGSIELSEVENFEEYLRLVMVRYYPKIKSGNFKKKEKERFFVLLSGLAEKALSDDYRILDAFNNAYEIIIKTEWDSIDQKEYIVPFFRIYKYLLSYHLKNI